MRGLALLCPGQGSQHPAMLDLALASPAGADAVRRAGTALGEVDLVALARGDGAFANAAAQPLVCAATAATWAALRDLLPAPRLAAGYSVGELAAYGCAGALGVEDLVALAARRAAAMDAASGEPGGLAGIRGLPVGTVALLAAEAGAELAIVNGPDHVVAGGPVAALEVVEARAKAAGAFVHRLPIAVAAHTAALGGAVAPFAAALAASPLADPAIPVLAGISGEPVRTRGDAIATLSRQVAKRIEWARCLAVAREMGCEVFLELGPGSALTRMAAEALPGVAARSVEDFRTAAGVARWVERAVRGG
ncbi:ACP S-malonyltransferase [Anaeromyxobacter oryzae]|uniref:Malonate decarboxylase subunit epsilon n=1 Tax=Anaeromyxobacter oryzae TaxID=2918170 RepID=A0ABM7X120_9BACT|nr:acyltransferase domain-containing protein [Anaeromyxobacter oryzae]BDG05501.1 malonate decarboxylase subunit epsilon [Anaeromyxobacter oryzae]